MATSGAALLELLCLCAGGFLLLHRPGRPASESLALGITLALLGLSALYQAAFLLGRPGLAFPAEALGVAASLGLGWRRRESLGALARGFRATLIRHPLATPALAAALAYLAAQALLLPPHGGDALTYHLPRVLLFQQEASLFPAHFAKHHMVVLPVGGDLLSHAFLRFHSDWGVSSFQLLGYLAVVLGSYALARRHAPEEVAFAAALVIASLPQLVYQATMPKNNVFTSQAAVASLLLGERLRARPSARDAALLLLVLSFGLSAKTTFLAFAAPFALGFGLLLARAHPGGAWRAALRARPAWIAGVLATALLLSQGWLFLHNRMAFGGWLGPPGFVAFHRNGDGLRGGLANGVRYLFQSAHGLEPVDRAAARLLGWRPSAGLQAAWDRLFRPHFGAAGLNRNYAEFTIDWGAAQDESWFGPLGFALVLPALVASLVRAPAAVAAAGLALLGTLALFAFSMAWFPWNARMLCPVFAASAGCVAHLLARLRPGRRAPGALGAAALAILAFAAWTGHPPEEWAWSRYGRDRLYGARLWFGEEALPRLAEPFAPGAEVALVVSGDPWSYYFLLRNPQARFTLLRPALARRDDPGFGWASILASRDPHFDAVVCLTGEQGVCREGEIVARERPGS
jgi:hypothetical protein